MNIPKKLKIGAIWWEVKEVEAHEIDCDGATSGDQSEFTQTIRIAKTLTPEMKQLVLLHEILHCIDSELDHDLVDLLATSLHQVLSENKFNYE